jgi:hypothetical protein
MFVGKQENTYFAMSNIRTEYTNQLALIKLYKTVVIPSCLYGCEIWNNLKNQDNSLLNRLQHFIVKHIQKLPKLTRSDICESLIHVGLNPITCEIEKSKYADYVKNNIQIFLDLIIENLCLELYVELLVATRVRYYTKFYLEKLRVPI